MKRSWICLLALLHASACQAQGRRAAKALERLKQVAIVGTNVMAPMRDGVKLATDIARPKQPGKYPVVLSRTPYGKRIGGGWGFIKAGYAVAVQDVRGRYASEGEFYPFIHDLDDAYDTIEWLAKQPWCDGNVGMQGGSYVGFTQLAAALTRPPHLRCIMPTVPPADFDRRTLFYGGALRMELAQGWLLGQSWRSQRVLRKEVSAKELERWQPHRSFRKWCWHVPLRDPGPIAIGGPGYAKCWRDILGNWERPGAWKRISAAVRPEDIEIPVLITAGFYDIFAQENIELLLALRSRGGSQAARTHSHLIIGPWVHGIGKPAGDVNFPKARSALHGVREKWLARWLKNEKNDVDEWPPIRAFIMGQDRWIETDVWPTPQSRPAKFYLAPGRLGSDPPTHAESSSTFTYDPAHPAQTVGGANLILPKGIRDHGKNAERPDVLSFVTDPLDREITVVGRLRARLFVSSSAPDTDFTAMLLDVRPDGYMANIQDGIVRARYRDGRNTPKTLRPHQIVEVDIDLWSTAYAFKKGHRVALHVSSSNFPRFDRSLNTGEYPADWTELQKAENRIHHDTAHSSYVELPIFP